MATAPNQAPAATQKQKLNVYTVMLITAGVSLIFGSVCLSLALGKFDKYPYWKITDDAEVNRSF